MAFFNINIADFNIKVFSKSKKDNLFLSENYASFSVNNELEPDIAIQVIESIPDKLISAPELFRARHEGSENDSPYFWSINKLENNLVLLASDPGSNIFPCLAMVFTKDSKIWKLHVSSEYVNKNERIDPFLYPMGPLIMYYMVSFNKAFMIHASAVNMEGNGLVFSGVSGIGKSTMANLWENKGAKIINDDRLIIRNINNEFFVYNTPMYYPDLPKKVKLSNIYLLNQEKQNRVNRLKGIKALTLLMANVIQHGYDKEMVNSLIENLTELVDKIAVYEVGFVPDVSIVDLIRKSGFDS